ncbi:malto-oligosyltrehalose synthase [Desulfohalovibrio reitneri]|uniref:malto-oligosyltrehalose synthase n=1 Tax=Desulfohalovibrio reitneri TaxID=1307759 RepID=UPI0004A6D369|nr:malto-oligosyltrehalose synthase [Desulfohalovibrio reitneri]
MIPTATYRIQFTPTFGFDECRKILGYLSRLGVSHIYASPIFQARPGSDHGYDVCDHNAINPELGGEEALAELTRARKRRKLGWIQDIVPNHRAVFGGNRTLVDLLENGSRSRYFNFFDIDWNHPIESLRGRMLAPFLGDLFAHTLENGEITIGLDEDGFYVRYYELRLPLSLDSYADILSLNLRELKRRLGEDHPEYVKLLGLIYSVRSLGAAEIEEEYYEQISFIKRLLFEMAKPSKPVGRHVNDNLAIINGEKPRDEERPYDLLAELLAKQHFRLSFWKVASEELNYRRFFSINDLICLRVEDVDVFDHTHEMVLEKTAEGEFDGLRIDHVDGLYDPTGYLRRLRERAPNALLYVEKILCREGGEDEHLPGFWPIQGSTGYEFMNAACGLLTDPGGEEPFESFYREFTGLKQSLDDLAVDKKRVIVRRHMTGDVDNLARHVNAVASRDLRGFDITMNATREAIAEVLCRFPVYRTYASGEVFRPADMTYIRQAINSARRAKPDLRHEFDFLERFLLLRYDDRLDEESRREWIHFVMRFQQYSGPLMAKGHEDTLLYVYNRLLSSNEVGGSPENFARRPDDFAVFVRDRAEHWPRGMNATASHDNKRGEDARMRLAALSQLPEQWRQAALAMREAAAPLKGKAGGRRAPDGNDEYLVYQCLLSHWPWDKEEREGFADRLEAYLVKAIREAKEHSGWLTPDEDYERAMVEFARELLDAKKGKAFREIFEPLWERVSRAGAILSLSQTMLKAVCPGLPDVYQGCELWDFSFVDPDNRRPVDYGLRSRLLTELDKAEKEDREGLLAELLESPEDGRVKLFVLSRLLRLRAEMPDLFERGGFEPLILEGQQAGCAYGFARTGEGGTAVALLPRLFASAAGETRLPVGAFWGDTRVADMSEAADLEVPLRDIFTSREFSPSSSLYLSEALKEFPLALLVPAQ